MARSSTFRYPRRAKARATLSAASEAASAPAPCGKVLCKPHLFSISWEIAAVAAKRFGGKKKDYFAEALRQQWRLFNSDVVTQQSHRIALSALNGRPDLTLVQQNSSLAAAASRARERMGALYTKAW